MTTKILTDLNNLVGKTPDQIVAALKSKGWIKGSNMTREQYEALRDGPQNGRVRLTEYYGNDLWWLRGCREDSCYHISDWSLTSINSVYTLGNYYLIAYEEYVDGHFPPVPLGG